MNKYYWGQYLQSKIIVKLEDLGINSDNDYILEGLNLELEMEYNSREIIFTAESVQDIELVAIDLETINNKLFDLRFENDLEVIRDTLLNLENEDL